MSTPPTPPESTRVFWRWEGPDWVELEFLRWTPSYLVVVSPPRSLRAGQPWRIHRTTVLRYHRQGVLYILGAHPFAVDVGPNRTKESTP